MAETATEGEKDAAFGASHTSFYTDAVAKDSYETLDQVLDVAGSGHHGKTQCRSEKCICRSETCMFEKT